MNAFNVETIDLMFSVETYDREKFDHGLNVQSCKLKLSYLQLVQKPSFSFLFLFIGFRYMSVSESVFANRPIPRFLVSVPDTAQEENYPHGYL